MFSRYIFEIKLTVTTAWNIVETGDIYLLERDKKGEMWGNFTEEWNVRENYWIWFVGTLSINDVIQFCVIFVIQKLLFYWSHRYCYPPPHPGPVTSFVNALAMCQSYIPTERVATFILKLYGKTQSFQKWQKQTIYTFFLITIQASYLGNVITRI